MTSVARATRAWAEARGLGVTFSESTGSTNDDAKGASPESTDDHLFVTEHQTRGRGRGSRVWADVGRGQILLSTWTFATAAPPQAITGPRVGLALHRAAAGRWPDLEWSLKAPNDLYLGEKKVAGLLVEVVSHAGGARVIVGLGFDVLGHPPAVATATDLAAHLGRAPTEAEWSDFLDRWRDELRGAGAEIVVPTLAPAVRRDLRLALNAFPGRSFDVVDVSPEGDLISADGVVRWTEL